MEREEQLRVIRDSLATSDVNGNFAVHGDGGMARW